MVIHCDMEGYGGHGMAQDDQTGYVHFRRYYRDVQRLLCAEDWERCEKLFFSPVPLSLRINQSTSMHHRTTQTLNETFGTRVELVPWMSPFGGALHVAPSASSKAACEGLQTVNLLTSTGEVVVQDGLSMLPAAALSVQPGDAVLDLCSAPGSKTCQLLDALGGHGILVANDVMAERSERVAARAKWQNCRPLMVTTTDGCSVRFGRK